MNRFSLRSLMILVALAAFGMWVAITIWRIWSIVSTLLRGSAVSTLLRGSVAVTAIICVGFIIAILSLIAFGVGLFLHRLRGVLRATSPGSDRTRPGR